MHAMKTFARRGSLRVLWDETFCRCVSPTTTERLTPQTRDGRTLPQRQNVLPLKFQNPRRCNVFLRQNVLSSGVSCAQPQRQNNLQKGREIPTTAERLQNSKTFCRRGNSLFANVGTYWVPTTTERIKNAIRSVVAWLVKTFCRYDTFSDPKRSDVVWSNPCSLK